MRGDFHTQMDQVMSLERAYELYKAHIGHKESIKEEEGKYKKDPKYLLERCQKILHSMQITNSTQSASDAYTTWIKTYES